MLKSLFKFSGELLDLTKYMVKDEESRLSCCSLCQFQSKIPAKVRNHLEAIHFPGIFIYSCNFCAKTFKGRNALGVHVSTVHNNTNRNR